NTWQRPANHCPYVGCLATRATIGETNGFAIHFAQHQQKVFCQGVAFNKAGPKAVWLKERVVAPFSVGRGVDVNHVIVKWREVSGSMVFNLKSAASWHRQSSALAWDGQVGAKISDRRLVSLYGRYCFEDLVPEADHRADTLCMRQARHGG